VANAARSSRERLTLIRVFEELRALGCAGGYDAIRRYAASWRRERSAATAAAFVPLSFAPGEAYQFDRSHEIVRLRRWRFCFGISSLMPEYTRNRRGSLAK